MEPAAPEPGGEEGDTGESKRQKKRKGQREFDWTKATFGHYVLKIAYVGTKYHGLAWQEPATTQNCPTVEGKLFEAFVKTCLIRDRAECSYSRCGRTDKGVHAAGNYVALQLRVKPGRKDAPKDAGAMEVEDYDYPSILNAVLPADIRVLAMARAPPGFDARFSCLYRAYQYYFPLAGEDLARMQEAAQHFIGEHDFRNFCKMDIENVTNFRRTIMSVSIEAGAGGVGVFAVTGQAFLWHQVRCLVAILLLVGSGHEEPALVLQLLDVEKCPRKPIYELADESGLVLRDCGFEGLPFAPGLPAPLAGCRNMPGVPSASSATETFRRMHLQALRSAAVHGCLLDASTAATQDSAASPLGQARAPSHTPLMQRAVAPSLEEKLSAFQARKRRKGGQGEDPAPDSGEE